MAIATKTGGDDLDDNFELDPDIVASGSDLGDSGSDDDDNDDNDEELGGEELDVEGEGDVPVLDDDDEEGNEAEGSNGLRRMNEGVKRKAESTNGNQEVSVEEKKRRKKEKEKERKAKRLARDAPSDIDPSLPPTHLPPESLLSLLRASLISTFPSLAPMEISDRLPPLASLLPAPDHAPPTNLPSGSFDPLRRRVAGLLKRGGKVSRGKPRVVVLCLSGMRCADVAREVREVKGEGQVAKLFAKHMKAADQKKFLSSTIVSVAIGTPARIGMFLADGTISVDKNTILLLDLGHQDSKTRTLLTMPDTRMELWKSVFAGASRKALIEGGARIGAF